MSLLGGGPPCWAAACPCRLTAHPSWKAVCSHWRAAHLCSATRRPCSATACPCWAAACPCSATAHPCSADAGRRGFGCGLGPAGRLPSGVQAQPTDLDGCELPATPRAQSAQPEIPHAHALELHDLPSDRPEHEPHLAVLPLDQRHVVQRDRRVRATRRTASAVATPIGVWTPRSKAVTVPVGTGESSRTRYSFRKP